MVSQELFARLPPFPGNVSIADVPKFSLSRLSSGDSTYARKVFETCCTTGFFLLDMGGEEAGDNIIKEIDAMFDISNNIFDLEVEEKSKYEQDTFHGKFIGFATPPSDPILSIGTDRQNKKDVIRHRITNSSPDGRMLA